MAQTMLGSSVLSPPPGGLFGRKRRAAQSQMLAPQLAEEVPAAQRRLFGKAPAMPGPIGGFGGGTWNLDGSAATPAMASAQVAPSTGGIVPDALRGNDALLQQQAMAQRAAAIAGGATIEAQEGAPNHWSVEGFDRMRAESPAPSQQGSMMGGGPLGGSMRQPFDYEKAIATLAGEQRKPKDWQKVLAVVGDVATSLGGGSPYAVRTMMAHQQAQQDRVQRARETILGWQHDAYSDQRRADLRAANPFTIGRDRLAYDPATGETSVLYRGPQDFQLYAEELGLEPGSEEYFKAVEDYVLKSNGPSAYDRNVSLDDHRTANDASLERQRFDNRRSMEQVRQSNRRGMVDYRNANPPPSRSRRGSPRPTIPTIRTPAEAARLPKGTRFRTPDGREKVS